MNYWEAKGAIRDLTAFRDAYVEWANSYRHLGLQAPAQIRIKLVRLAPVMQYRLNDLGPGAGTWQLQDPPALGGRTHSAYLSQLILAPDLAEKYRVQPAAVIEFLESAIGAYESMLPELHRKLYNPFYWLGLAFGLGLRIPFAFLEGAGFNVRPFERTTGGRVIKLAWFGSALGIVSNLLGLLDVVPRLLDSLF